MKKALNIFFVTLGIIFFILILIGAYVYFADPLGFWSAPTETTNDAHPYMSPTQEKALESFGVDPTDLPTKITPEQEACFVEKLGQERVDEIKGGAAPTINDYLKAKGCIN